MVHLHLQTSKRWTLSQNVGGSLKHFQFSKPSEVWGWDLLMLRFVDVCHELGEHQVDSHLKATWAKNVDVLEPFVRCSVLSFRQPSSCFTCNWIEVGQCSRVLNAVGRNDVAKSHWLGSRFNSLRLQVSRHTWKSRWCKCMYLEVEWLFEALGWQCDVAFYDWRE